LVHKYGNIFKVKFLHHGDTELAEGFSFLPIGLRLFYASERRRRWEKTTCPYGENEWSLLPLKAGLIALCFSSYLLDDIEFAPDLCARPPGLLKKPDEL
jgi:hypothetical protein